MADIQSNNDLTYDSYLGPNIDPFVQQILSITAITSLNGLTGPTVTLGGGSTGFSYAPSGSTLTLVGPLTTKGDLYSYSTVGTRFGVGTDGQVLTADSASTAGLKWVTPGAGVGTVTDVSVVSANGFAGTVAMSTTTPAITLTTTITGVLKGNGTAISAALSADIISALGYTPTNAAIVPNTAPAAGQILVGNAGGTAYAPVAMSSDATLANTGALTLASVITAAGPIGDATHVPQITYDAKGRLTTVTSILITGTAPGGSAGGDLSGTYPNPTVAKINGATLGTTTATSGNVLIGSGSQWATQTISGSGATITLSNAGVITISAIANASLSNSAITIAGTSTSLGGSITLDTITGVSSNGFLKRTGANTLTNIADPLPANNGGTGVANNVASTITISGSFATTFTVTNTTSVTLPTSGTLLTTTGSGASLTGIPTSITGTANQITASAATGAITLSIPTTLGWTATSGLEYVSPGSASATTFTLTATDTGTPQYNGNGCAIQLSSDGSTNGTILFSTNQSGIGSAERLRITNAGNVKIGGSASRGTTEGTKQLVIFNGTAPAGTLSNGVCIYSSSGECFVMDAGGTATQLSSHEKATGEWIHHSFSKHKRLVIKMEQLCKFIDAQFGTSFVQEILEV